ncbi:indoleamine 2,3-dioxygenase [Oleiphilus messinensis]|uniref:Indoleamine 2,3-dioxygenase n=1 Tax=Oleiphilus messinensis TaxID=141451 RepID=A0A1Y0IGV1_9GAMM|nr:hypothetical protein [Oleiphilus messinensis]ARU59369.1 indoleamine 2,3-dioxygenase [Oleiphilus messinensis]
MLDDLAQRGFLPRQDPATDFQRHSELHALDQLGRDLPSLLLENDFRQFACALTLPHWPEHTVTEASLPELRLYYVRLGFLASAYINQVGQAQAKILPKNIAVPLVAACKLLKRPPILSYDGYALYNWKRFNINKPIALGNIDTIQNFVHLYDEHWFILVHVEIEAKAALLLSAIEHFIAHDNSDIDSTLNAILSAMEDMVSTLKRIPERMSPDLYFSHFRPYIRFFEHVEYEGTDIGTIDFRGETGAQSSIIPVLVSFLKIPHEATELTDHLRDMRRYMPISHVTFLEQVEKTTDIRLRCDKTLYNNTLEAIAQFREIHYQWAIEYIDKHVADPRGTGGTPYMRWLKQLIDETRGFKIQ